jgi:two-component system, chemotaxis family, chemotaxis protein CheY
MLTLLIVDDSSTVRRLIISALRPMNASFSEAASGLEAIEKLALRRYDAVTLDLNMPDMHGIEFLQFVRTHKPYKTLPVLVITTLTDESVLEQAMQAGADAYLLKPFKPVELLNSLRVLLDPNKVGRVGDN